VQSGEVYLRNGLHIVKERGKGKRDGASELMQKLPRGVVQADTLLQEAIRLKRLPL
jgi:hypothetical protein